MSDDEALIPYDVGPDHFPSGRPFRNLIPRANRRRRRARRFLLWLLPARRVRISRAVSDWGVRHADGKVTVHITGHAFPSRAAAEREMAGFEDDCEWCDGGHEIVRRDVPPWESA